MKYLLAPFDFMFTLEKDEVIQRINWCKKELLSDRRTAQELMDIKIDKNRLEYFLSKGLHKPNTNRKLI